MECGRPRNYKTEEERKAAKAEATRLKLQKMRETDPEGYKEWVRNKYERQAQRVRDARALVEQAEKEGEGSTLRPEVVQAREYLERVRSWNKEGRFKRYYDSHPEFRERHRAKMAEYSRQRYARLKEAKAATA